MTDLMNTVAKNIGISTDQLKDRVDAVLAENQNAWVASGKTNDECDVLAIRVAGRQLKAEAQKLSRSGAEILEGMFVSVPRYKDWAKLAYKKMKDTLTPLSDDARVALVSQGRITLIQDNLDGSYTHTVNPSFKTGAFSEDNAELTISELPKFCEQLDDTTWFQIIENNTTPVYPSGDPNPRFGRARRLSEPSRESLFLGRKNGDDDVQLITVKTEGDLAETIYPTFVPGRIPVRMGRNGVGYGKVGVTKFTADDAVASIFAVSPLVIGENGPAGLIPKLVDGTWPNGDFLPSFDLLPEHIAKWADTDERWDKLCAVHGEVVHIDPREKGGYIITVGDLDITSTAPAVDVYVPGEQEDLINFGVGSEIALVGRAWMSRDNEPRLDCTGWFICDAIASDLPTSDGDNGGWDA